MTDGDGAGSSGNPAGTPAGTPVGTPAATPQGTPQGPSQRDPRSPPQPDGQQQPVPQQQPTAPQQQAQTTSLAQAAQQTASFAQRVATAEADWRRVTQQQLRSALASANPVQQQQQYASPVAQQPIQFGSMPPQQTFVQQPAPIQQQAQQIPVPMPAQQPVARNLFGTPQNTPAQTPLPQPMQQQPMQPIMHTPLPQPTQQNVPPLTVGMPPGMPPQQPVQFMNPMYTGNVAMQPVQQQQPFLPMAPWTPGRAGGVSTMLPNQTGVYRGPTGNYTVNAPPSTPANAAATAMMATAMTPQGDRNPGANALETFKFVRPFDQIGQQQMYGMQQQQQFQQQLPTLGPAEIPHPNTGTPMPYWCVNGRRIRYVTANAVAEDAKYDPQSYRYLAQLGMNDVNCIQVVSDDGVSNLLERDWPNLDNHGNVQPLNIPSDRIFLEDDPAMIAEVAAAAAGNRQVNWATPPADGAYNPLNGTHYWQSRTSGQCYDKFGYFLFLSEDRRTFDNQIERYSIFAYYTDMQIYDRLSNPFQGYANIIVQHPVYRADREPSPHPEPKVLDLEELYAAINGPVGMLDEWDPSPHAKVTKDLQLSRAKDNAILNPAQQPIAQQREHDSGLKQKLNYPKRFVYSNRETRSWMNFIDDIDQFANMARWDIDESGMRKRLILMRDLIEESEKTWERDAFRDFQAYHRREPTYQEYVIFLANKKYVPDNHQAVHATLCKDFKFINDNLEKFHIEMRRLMKEAMYNLYAMDEHTCLILYEKYPSDLQQKLREKYEFISCNSGTNSFLGKSYDQIVDMVEYVAKMMQKYTTTLMKPPQKRPRDEGGRGGGASGNPSQAPAKKGPGSKGSGGKGGKGGGRGTKGGAPKGGRGNTNTRATKISVKKDEKEQMMAIKDRDDYMHATTDELKKTCMQKKQCLDCGQTGHTAGSKECSKHGTRVRLDREAGRIVDKSGQAHSTEQQRKAADAKIAKATAANTKAMKENANQIAALKKQNTETQAAVAAAGETMSKMAESLAAITLKLMEKP